MPYDHQQIRTRQTSRLPSRSGTRMQSCSNATWCLDHEDLRSATLISLLAYAGPRPESEALPLPWTAIRRRTILFRASKRGVAYERATRLLVPLAQDLETWRTACGDPPDDVPVITNSRGNAWTEYD